ASSTAAINPLKIKGAKFFDSVTGEQFFIKGVAYQPSGPNGSIIDPLADPTTCKRDIEYFTDLGLNTIRVYQVDNTLNHDECMNALADKGIYLVLDLSTPKYSINRKDPRYDVEILNHYKKTADAFAGYPNVIGFFAGNEVVNNVNATHAAPFVKASIRDLKAHMKTKTRHIPIGYSTNDAAETRVQCADYFNCGEEADRVDFYGYNIYSWCGDDATFVSSQYYERTQQFSTYSAPVFLSEFGCNTNGVRSFHQVKAIFGPDMDTVFSGGIVYEYTEEKNNYGLVTITDGEVTKRQCYQNLKTELESVDPTKLTMSSYSSSLQPSQCPAIGADWNASTKIPPTPSEELCSEMYNSLECVLNEKTDPSAYGTLYGYVASKGISSADVDENGTTGTYGKYAGCSPAQRLSYMLNQYYLESHKKPTSCNFDGKANIVTPTGKSPSTS
ncbi:hypothetical protein K493DRAFT_141880, partial [Basidiobolus meristosporus CBS 931.73]